MTAEKKDKLDQLMRKINLVNGFRLAFLSVGVLLLLFIYFGQKFFETAEWFIAARAVAFRITEWDVIFLVIATFVKVALSVRYNHIVRNS